MEHETDLPEPSTPAQYPDDDSQPEAHLIRPVAAIVACEILRWIINDGKASPAQIKLRAYVAIWMMAPELVSTSQVEMSKIVSKVMGKGVKQHLGRPMEEFTKRFGFKRSTMQSDSAHSKAFERERIKRERLLTEEAEELEAIAKDAGEEL